MKKVKLKLAVLLGTLAAFTARHTRSRKCIALANQLGLISEHGIQTLIVDPATSFPVANKYLLWQRGSGVYYAALAQSGNHMPLGPSSDSPFQLGDLLNIRRLGCRKGFELGMSYAAIGQDNLLVSAGNGLVADQTTIGAGTWWVVGRAIDAVSAASMEVAYAPCFPYSITQ
jgi:hypothetical protein